MFFLVTRLISVYYIKEKRSCGYCGRVFENGEVINVSNKKEGEKELTFCYSDAGGGCLIGHIANSGKNAFAQPMIFGAVTEITKKNSTPNYPKIPNIH